MMYNRTRIPGNINELSANILKSIKPLLKAPITAVLCSNEELIINYKDGIYTVEGYVSSQNSYGAMIDTSFISTAKYVNNRWLIIDSNIGVKEARAKAQEEAIKAASGQAGFILACIIVVIVAILEAVFNLIKEISTFYSGKVL